MLSFQGLQGGGGVASGMQGVVMSSTAAEGEKVEEVCKIVSNQVCVQRLKRRLTPPEAPEDLLDQNGAANEQNMKTAPTLNM